MVFALDLSGIPTAVRLDRIRERFAPDEVELTLALAHATVLPVPRARTLAHAFQYFWLGKLDAAACIALPHIEQILRQLLRPQVPIVSVAKGQTPGTIDQLGRPIRNMPAAGYPADWSRALELLLTHPGRGVNLRNDVCHGLIGTPPKNRVALIRQAALYLLSHTGTEASRFRPSPSFDWTWGSGAHSGLHRSGTLDQPYRVVSSRGARTNLERQLRRTIYLIP
ncbi:DUF4209 domain-containing protein [Streptacidiphilus melanogenes]|uniref:DUF4209 domain-containing protein n=1 Tax=Streptacidiphilus melanogenes TaxID=411235 RepID=UPI0005A9C6CB|nr:DUF4209 domain-containing protein [Streptacidiphilus melanogenes]